MKILEYENNNKLAEIYQKSTSIFAFVKKVDDAKYIQCTQYVKCRDFLNDVVRGVLQQVPIAIYGFKYDTKKDPMIDMENISLLFKDPNKDIEFTVLKALKIINYYESILKTDYSNYTLVDKNTAIITGPKVWLRSQVLTSLYTLLFRVAELKFEINNENIQNLTQVYEDFINVCKNSEGVSGDTSYLSRIYKNLEVFLHNYEKVLELDKNEYDPIIYNKDISLHNFHNYTGIVSLLDDAFKSYADNTRKALFKKTVEEVAIKKVGEATKTKDIITIYDNYKFEDVYRGYHPFNLNFTFVTTISNKRLICHKPVYCREQLVDAFRSLCSKESKKEIYFMGTEKRHNVDTKKLRLLACVRGIGLDEDRMQYHKRELFFAKKVINYYEKLAGFKPSMISTAICKSASSSDFAWLFTGSSDWMLSPILLSLYPLIIRAAKKYVQIEATNKNVDNLPKIITADVVVDMWNKVKEYNKSKNDVGHDNIFADKNTEIIKLLLAANKIFVEPLEKAFCIDNKYTVAYHRNVNDCAYSTSFGINSLLSGNYVNKLLQKKINLYLESN